VSTDKETLLLRRFIIPWYISLRANKHCLEYQDQKRIIDGQNKKKKKQASEITNINKINSSLNIK
jgi:hypothetical protein